MEQKITVTDLAQSLADVLDRVKNRGERFIIERDGEPVAMLAPVSPPKSITLGELFALLRTLPPLDDEFAKDVEEIRAMQSDIGEPPSWPD
ncbi:MAG: type II toxin-antitoxin system Phd/YefM family antitoxin [Chloroflexi bacterium]|nr:type II toxin-antitoxin system Phd/YefM family antitoxin [Chloroflexota bacterium]